MKKYWQEVKIKDIAKIIGGYAFKSKDFVQNGDVPVIKIKNLKDNNLIIDNGDFISQSFLKLNEKYHINYNDILIALTGSHITLPSSAVGRVAKSKHERTLLLNQRVGKFVVDSSLCDHDFLYYNLITEYFFESIGLRAKGAANQANISGGDVGEIKLKLPPLNIQREIASILSAYDDLIENNLNQIKLLEEKAQLTYEDWFVRMKFPGHESIEIDKGTGLPEGWTELPLGKLVTLVKDTEQPQNLPSDTPYIGLEHMPRKSITLSEWEYADKIQSTKYRFSKFDILFGKIRPYFHKVGFALTDGISSTDAIILRPKKFINHGLILQTVFTEHFVDTATQSSNGTKMPRANWKVLKNYPVIIPAEYILEKFQNLSQETLILIGNLVKQNQLLKEARDILLPRLMTGMIDVERLELEEINKRPLDFIAERKAEK